MMQVPPFGAFVRALLPIRLTGGHKLTYGVWVGVHPDDLQRTFAVWWEPEYQDLRLDGRLANSVKPWGMLGAPVSLPRPHARRGRGGAQRRRLDQKS